MFKQDSDDQEGLKDLLTAPEPPDTIGQAAVPYGLTYARVQGVGAVKGLNSTGAPALPSELRDRLIAEMKTHDVATPETYLESKHTALVITEAIMPPGVKRGAKLDVNVQTPARTDVTSLQGGWLMPSRMQEMRRLDGAIRSSDVAVIGTGSVLVRGLHDGNGQEMMVEGRLLGGGTAQVDRPVGLVIRPKYQHVLLSAQFAKAINNRFFFFDGSTRRGIATPREDDFVEVDVLPRYEHNVHRLIAVVRSIPVKRPEGGLQQQLGDLARKLKEPTTAGEAALTLEAIGDDAVPVLVDALQTPNDEIRFYVAEALAYLDREEAIEPLKQLAIAEPAFRYPAFKALQGMPQRAVTDTLRTMLNESSNEVRYGAFVALRERSDARLVVGGQAFGDGFFVHSIPSTADALIAISLTKRAEIVVFGPQVAIELPESVISGGGIIIRETQPGQLRLSRFTPHQEDRVATVPANIASLCAGVASLGGGYSDCVDVLRVLKAEQAFAARMVFDPSPRPLRTYYRDEDQTAAPESRPSLGPQDITPAPEKPKSFIQRISWWQNEEEE